MRASIPSDRSFAAFDTALAHFNAPPLPAGIELPWQQALLDVQLEAPIESPSSLFSLRARTERLGMRVVNAVRFIGESGTERVFQIEGDAGVVPLDPRWHQSLFRFLVQGFEHILDGADHLLFLLCLVVPFRRQLRALVWIVTAFTAGHSVTLIASAYGLAPNALWFPPLVETLIALSIFYMAVENVVLPEPALALADRVRLRARARLRLLVRAAEHAAIRRRSRAHVALVVQHRHRARPAARARAGRAGAELLFRYVDARVGGIVIAVIVGHTAWHWLAERFAALRNFAPAAVLAGIAASPLPWLAGAVVVALFAWRVARYLASAAATVTGAFRHPLARRESTAARTRRYGCWRCYRCFTCSRQLRKTLADRAAPSRDPARR